MNNRNRNPRKNEEIEELESYKVRLDNIIITNNRELIPVLQRTQDMFGFLPKNALIYIAQSLDLPLAHIYGVVTFYNRFRLKPVGKYLVKVCCGTACHVAGAESLTQSISKDLDIPEGETTPDKMFTLEKVACVGCCSLAPVIVVNKEIHAKVTINDSLKMIKNHRREKKGA